MAAGALLANAYPGDWKPPAADTVNFAGSDQTRQHGVRFNGGKVAGEQEYCIDFRLPAAYEGGTIAFHGLFKPDTSRGGVASFVAVAKKREANKPLDKDADIGVSVAGTATVPSNSGYTFTLTLAIPKDAAAAGDFVRVWLLRRNLHADDTCPDGLTLVTAQFIEGS